MNTSKCAVIYARVATEEALNDGKLSAQVETCRQYATQHGFTVTAEHIITEVYTGITLKRPGLDRVRALTAEREVDAVIVFTVDRLSRDAAHLRLLYEERRRIGIDVHYANR
jgi:site-specific DNA recombinase